MIESEGGYGQLIQRLRSVATQVEADGIQWVMASAKYLEQRIIHYLDEQAKDASPPLSGMTLKIYEMSEDKEPDSSGIREALEVYYKANRASGRFIAGVRITDEKAAMIAYVQNHGTVVKVTEATRGLFSAKYGINLKDSTTELVIPGRGFYDKAVADAKEYARQESKKMKKKIKKKLIS